MRRALAACRAAVVTTNAGAGVDCAVVKLCRQPAYDGVAEIAAVAGGDVGGVFAAGNDAVVATFTAAQYLVVVDAEGLGKGEYIVAAVALGCGRDVSARLTNGNAAVMTGDTGGSDFIVIE